MIEIHSDRQLFSQEDICKQVLISIGEDPNREGLIETPKRMAKAWSEIFAGYKQEYKHILSKFFICDNDQMVICKDIEFYSMCEHHFLPFYGKVHIGYVPQGKVIGLSKLARVVECFAKRLQIQENMTQQIAGAIQEVLNPKGVMVITEAQHLCMKMRGVRNHSSVMTTSSIKGCFKDLECRNEFLELIK